VKVYLSEFQLVLFNTKVTYQNYALVGLCESKLGGLYVIPYPGFMICLAYGEYTSQQHIFIIVSQLFNPRSSGIIKTSYPIARRLFAMRRYGGGML